MNKTLLILATLLFISSELQSQTLVQNGNRWITRTEGGSYSSGQLEIWRSDDLYEIPLVDADSSYNNQSYKKLFLESDFSTLRLIGLLRETNDSIVYYLPKSDTTEKVLYDFGAKIGDTIQNYYSTQNDVIVTDTFSRGIEITSFGLEEFWLYGIGGETGFLETGYGQLLEIGRSLICMSDINGRRYPSIDTTASLCERYISPITNRPERAYELKIVPNPIEDFFNLENDGLGVFKIYILDLKGVLVFYKECQKGELHISDERLKNISKGVYSLVIESESKGVASKQIVIE